MPHPSRRVKHHQKPQQSIALRVASPTNVHGRRKSQGLPRQTRWPSSRVNQQLQQLQQLRRRRQTRVSPINNGPVFTNARETEFQPRSF
jgi:hypothetical protein